MIQSLIVYTLSASILCWLSRNVCIREQIELIEGRRLYPFFSFEALLCITFFAIFAGIRYQVGTDYLSYFHAYIKTQASNGVYQGTAREPGFALITELFAKCNCHFVLYFGLLAALQLGSVYYAVRKHKSVWIYIAFYVILGPFFLTWMNGIRQSIAVCFFTCLVPFIVERRLFSYIVGVYILSLIHTSVLLVLPIYFLKYVNVSGLCVKRNIVLLIACVACGELSGVINIIRELIPLIELVGYDDYARQVEYHTGNNQIIDMAWGPSKISFFVTAMLIIVTFPRVCSFYKNDNMLNQYFSLFFVGECLYYILCNTSYLFLRPVEYFTIFRLLLFGFMVNYCFKSKKRSLGYFSLLIVAVYIYWNIYKLSGAENEAVLYKFFFEHI